MRRIRYIILLIILAAATFSAGAQVQDTIIRRHSALDYQLQSKPRLEHFPSKMPFEQFFSISQYVAYSIPQGVTVGVDMCKFFTPVIGLRAGINIGEVRFPDLPVSEMYHPKLDVVLDLGAFAWGYNPKRVFTIWGIIGADGALLRHSIDEPYRFAYGMHMALSFDFRLSNTLHLSIEPTATLFSNQFNGVGDWYIADPIADFRIGLNYRRPVVTDRFYQALRGSKRNFVSIGAGIQSLPMCTISRHLYAPWRSIGACMMLNIGRWLSPLSGIRATFSYGVSPFTKEEEATQHVSILGVSLDYLYHLSNGENYSNTFSWAIVAGVNFVHTGITKRFEMDEVEMTFGVNSGINVCYNLNPSVSFYLEPKATIFGTEMAASSGRLMLNLNTGMIYRW